MMPQTVYTINFFNKNRAYAPMCMTTNVEQAHEIVTELFKKFPLLPKNYLIIAPRQMLIEGIEDNLLAEDADIEEVVTDCVNKYSEIRGYADYRNRW